MLQAAGFANLFIGTGNLEVVAYAFTGKASDYATALLKLPPVTA